MQAVKLAVFSCLIAALGDPNVLYFTAGLMCGRFIAFDPTPLSNPCEAVTPIHSTPARPPSDRPTVGTVRAGP